ncbi:MAG: metalloregulator ArsR/SmtB family transcription factor [Candidatus Omnitrophica bacterium]|nr:metalloregulator ArsR/SmtB family transcription factor [Candidatus Omnitrophota bacterium]
MSLSKEQSVGREDLERIFKALANANRLRILKMFQEKPMCVCEIRFVLGISQPTVSRHLQVLKQAGLIENRTQGPWVNYQIRNYPTGHPIKTILSLLSSAQKEEIFEADRKRMEKANRYQICRRK